VRRRAARGLADCFVRGRPAGARAGRLRALLGEARRQKKCRLDRSSALGLAEREKARFGAPRPRRSGCIIEARSSAAAALA
jgi:hypothetical protein